MPQLDGLRALAVFPVLYQHWFSPRLPVGYWGVILFFVISGYLITRSLLLLKASGLSLVESGAKFFGRRAARLFPAYYALLRMALVLDPGVRDTWNWYFLYLSNVRLAIDGHYIPLTPTWSLAVEEQFYVGWFLAVLMLTRRRRLLLSGALIVASVVFRACVFLDGWANYLLPACLDALALGSLLCDMDRRAPRWSALALPALLGLAALLAIRLEWNQPANAAFGPLVVAVAALLAVWRARDGFGGWLGLVLEWRPVMYLGRISYGIYLYHIMTRELFNGLPFLWRVNGVGWEKFGLHVAMTIALAALSYHLLEQPILNRRALAAPA